MSAMNNHAIELAEALERDLGIDFDTAMDRVLDSTPARLPIGRESQ